MLEPPARAPFEGGREQNPLLATKFQVPRLRAGFVPRPRLLERLRDGQTCELILVCAPAGFGKTALMAEWSRGSGRPAAWLSLEAADGEPARFWRHVVEALDGPSPGVAKRVGPLLGPPAPSSFEGFVTALINDLADQVGEVLLVLDDYHLVDSASVHGSLAFLLEHLPSGMQLMLASRSTPPLPLERLRARGQVIELRPAELRFTAAEGGALLREAVGADLPDSVSAALVSRTEGWVAGLQLAALSLRGRADVGGFVATFGGSHRYVFDYLTEEVLERQPEHVRAFLLETSVLDELSGPLCDAVTGRTESQSMLESVEKANLFLLPLDDVRGWWRYHQLFGDVLRGRLQQEHPGRAQHLHRRAAEWYGERGLVDRAVRHALVAGETTWAARLIERHADAAVLHGEGTMVQRWLVGLPADLIGSRPRLLLLQARLALLSNQLEVARISLDAAERPRSSVITTAAERFEPSAGTGASLLANIPATIALDRAYLAALEGDAEGAYSFSSRALSEVGDGEWMLESHARGYLGLAEWLRGNLQQAEVQVSSSIERWLSAGEPWLALRGCHHLGQIQRARGDLTAAHETYRRALEVAAPEGQSRLPGAGVGYVGLAELAYERDELDAALRFATEGIALCRQVSYRQPLATGLAALAWIRQVSGDAAGAQEAILEAEKAAPGPDLTGLLNPVPARKARLLLARGDIAAAVRWTEERGIGPEDEPAYPREAEHLVLARVLIRQGKPGQAARFLERLLAAALAEGRTGSVVELRALKALAIAAEGDEERAVTTLGEALKLAHPQGYVRVFADEGVPMGELLFRLVAARRTDEEVVNEVPLGYLARLLTASRGRDNPEGRGVRSQAAGLFEPLTARELELLRLLAAGKSNQAIAEEAFITLDTVKKHISHILEKLGATNRTEAVARARELSLLS